MTLAVLIVAAIVGDTVNYWVGAYIGPRAFRGDIRFLRQEYLERTGTPTVNGHKAFQYETNKALQLSLLQSL